MHPQYDTLVQKVSNQMYSGIPFVAIPCWNTLESYWLDIKYNQKDALVQIVSNQIYWDFPFVGIPCWNTLEFANQVLSWIEKETL